MNRTLFVALAIVCGVSALIVASKRAESGAADALVRLQASSPGAQQIGSANLSGTFIAGQLRGGGAGITALHATSIASGTLSDARLSSNVALLSGAQSFSGAKTFAVAPSFSAATPFSVTGNGNVANLNADLLDGLDSSTFLQSIPFPLTLSGSSSGPIVSGQNSSTNSGSSGVFGSSTAASGATYGGHFVSASDSGYGVYGKSSAVSGLCFGGRFESASSQGFGVYGLSTSYIGVAGQSDAQTGTGVWGTVSGLTGANYGGRFESGSANGRGVFGLASTIGANDIPYGVRGQASTATLGFAVYAVGDMGASGVKPFRIDHPLDPENKYLLHYSSESPFPQNFYNGNVMTDSEGYAWVELPDYFAEINTNFKYILTVVDDLDSEAFVQAKISKKIKDNRFQIRTSAPNVEVSWEVKADRNDLRIRANRPTDVREKSGPENGKYQHPEYYGLGPEHGMDYESQSGKAGRNRR